MLSEYKRGDVVKCREHQDWALDKDHYQNGTILRILFNSVNNIIFLCLIDHRKVFAHKQERENKFVILQSEFQTFYQQQLLELDSKL